MKPPTPIPARHRSPNKLPWIRRRSLTIVIGLIVAAQARQICALDDVAMNLETPQGQTSFIFATLPNDVKEALDEFGKYARRKQWEKAFQSLQKATAAGKTGMLPNKEGFYYPTYRRLRELLSELPAEGQEAYRLFNDPEAKKVYDKAVGRDEYSQLERVYSEYLMTSVGATAAERLGDLRFEQGDLVRAVECWQSILQYRPDAKTPMGWLHVKIATALARAGRWEDAQVYHRAAQDKYGDEAISVAGQATTVREALARLAQRAPKAGDGLPTSDELLDFRLAPDTKPAWKFLFMDEQTQKVAGEMDGWWESIRVAVKEMAPPTVVQGDRLYVNLVGKHFCLDVATGKLVWRTERFHDIRELVKGQNAWFGELMALSGDSKNLYSIGKLASMRNSYQGRFTLTCLNIADGKTAWQSNTGDAGGYSISGAPLPVGDVVYVAGYKQNRMNELCILAINTKDGKTKWVTSLGTQQIDFSNMYHQRNPQPNIVYDHGKLYVQSHVGALTELDAATGVLNWGFVYETENPDQNRWYGYMPDTYLSQPPMIKDGVLYAKGMRSPRVVAIQLNGPKKLWERPVNMKSVLIGVDSERAYIGGEEICAIDRKSNAMLWSAAVPIASGWTFPMMTKSRIYQFTSRGLFELDRRSGETVQVFRGADRDSMGGVILLTPKLLILVSNVAATAYPIDRGG